MSFEENKTIIERFVETFNAGNIDIIDELIARDFYNYSPPAGEETAPEVLKQLAGDLKNAIPDLKLEVSDFVDESDTISFDMNISGTHSNVLWGAPGSGKSSSWSSRVTSRFSNGKFAFYWKDLPVPSMLATLRQLNLVPQPDDMDKPPKHPISLPEIILKIVFTGQVKEKECSHFDMVKVTEPAVDVCQDCVALGDIWPGLRMCLTCGYVGCCDTAKNKHMKEHFEKSGHPLIRSIRLEESWAWCYEDDAFFPGKYWKTKVGTI